MATKTFADVCDDLRRARSAHLRAIAAHDAAMTALKRAVADREKAGEAEDAARGELGRFIDRQVALD